MPRYIVTVRERVDYTLTIDAPDSARAGDAALALCVQHGGATAACRECSECSDVRVADRQAIEIEET